MGDQIRTNTKSKAARRPRFAGYLDQGLIPLVPDHDPNGIDIHAQTR